jgi:hypothetical protein
MQTLAQRFGTARAAVSRARAYGFGLGGFGLGFGLMANASWSIAACPIVATTDHKHVPSRRPTVFPG